jgi:hypothetical protein
MPSRSSGQRTIGELRQRVIVAPPAVPRANVTPPFAVYRIKDVDEASDRLRAPVLVENAKPAISDGSRPGGASGNGRYCSLAAKMILR